MTNRRAQIGADKGGKNWVAMLLQRGNYIVPMESIAFLNDLC